VRDLGQVVIGFPMHIEAGTLQEAQACRLRPFGDTDRRRVINGHFGDATDPDCLKDVMDNGSCIGIDALPSFEDRVKTEALLSMCRMYALRASD
jgi:hypothetical protein